MCPKQGVCCELLGITMTHLFADKFKKLVSKDPVVFNKDQKDFNRILA